MTSTEAWAGPAWSPSGLRVFAGRYPLSVEAHVIRMVALLVPGATTVTPHSRYYALHALAASEAARRSLDRSATLELLRRCEVVLGGISVLHEHRGFPRAHGADVIAPHLARHGTLDIATLHEPRKGAYVEAQAGYWSPYIGSELLLQIIDNGRSPLPGPRCDEQAVRDGLDGLLDLAARDEISADELREAHHLCLCAGGPRTDGAWLRRLLCAPPMDDSASVANVDAARRETAQLLARVVAHHGEVGSVTSTFLTTVAFGRFVDEDERANKLGVTQPWRGLLLRHYSVGAWRRIWSWLVDQVEDFVPPTDLEAAFADALPDLTVRQFIDDLPATVADGAPAPAEEIVRGTDWSRPARELAVLATGALRTDDLTGAARETFVGRDIELAPRWMQRRLVAHPDQSLRDFGRELTADLLTRARRVAMLKIRRGRDGRLALPTRLHERGGNLYRTSREGAGDVGLRVGQLTTVLAGVGVFEWGEAGWRLTEEGRDALR